MCTDGDSASVRSGAFYAASGTHRPFTQGLWSNGHDAEGAIRLPEAQVRWPVGQHRLSIIFFT